MPHFNRRTNQSRALYRIRSDPIWQLSISRRKCMPDQDFSWAGIEKSYVSSVYYYVNVSYPPFKFQQNNMLKKLQKYRKEDMKGLDKWKRMKEDCIGLTKIVEHTKHSTTKIKVLLKQWKSLSWRGIVYLTASWWKSIQLHDMTWPVTHNKPSPSLNNLETRTK